jgi:hypothetical protein
MSTIKQLWERERKINEIERLKQKNEHDLVMAANNLEEKKKTNKYLEDIIEEFSGYKNDLIMIKRSQEARMEDLVKYLEDNLNDAGLNDVQIRKVEKERRDIEERLKNIRNELRSMNIDYSEYN